VRQPCERHQGDAGCGNGVHGRRPGRFRRRSRDWGTRA
jgi:hypothetical protein